MYVIILILIGLGGWLLLDERPPVALMIAAVEPRSELVGRLYEGEFRVAAALSPQLVVELQIVSNNRLHVH